MSIMFSSNLSEGKIDLNAMFNLSLNFDLLKNIISHLLQTEQELKEEITKIKAENIKNQSLIINAKEDLQTNTQNELENISKEYIDKEISNINELYKNKISKLEKRVQSIEKSIFNHDYINNENIDNENTKKEDNDNINNSETILNSSKSLTSKINGITAIIKNQEKKYDEDNSSNLSSDEENSKKKSNYEKMGSLLSDMIKKLKEEITINTNNMINKKMKEHIKKINPISIDKVNELINSQTEVFNINHIQLQNNLETLKKNYTQKTKEIEDKSIQSDIKQNNIQKQINDIKSKFILYTLTKDFQQYKTEQLEFINNHISDYKTEIDKINKKISDIISDVEICMRNEDIKSKFKILAKKVDQVIRVNDIVTELTKKVEILSNMQQTYDLNNYTEIKVFNEFKTNTLKTLEKLKLQTDRNSDNFSDFADNVSKNKASLKDLRDLEESFNVKLENYKTFNKSSFADKSETKKLLKYLEQQISQMYSDYIKQNEGNWLIAKKPFNGHVCASCENVIGDLKDQTQYVPWNRAKSTLFDNQVYSIGNGFSKMLKLMKKDVKSTKNHNDSNYLDIEDTRNLPNLNKLNKSTNIIFSDCGKDELLESRKTIYEDNNNQTKIMKVFKLDK